MYLIHDAIQFKICNEKNTVLYMADVSGWVSIYDISRTALRNDLESSVHIDTMPRITSFKAHTEDITDMLLVDKHIVTSSTDCTVRMFTQKGEFIGIFGQQASWDSDNLDLQSASKPLDLLELSDTLQTDTTSKIVAPDSSLSPLELKKAISKPDADAVMLESWFSKSLYAKERFINRPRKTLVKSHNRIYHELAEITSLILPKLV